MSNAKEVRNKILCVQNTQKITKAMEMVAASKMRKSQERMSMSRPYAESIRQVISHITSANLEYKHPYLNMRHVKSKGYLVISTDRGLCGSLNSHLFKKLSTDIKVSSDKGIASKLAIIGLKGGLFFRSVGSQIVAQIQGINDKPTLSDLIGPVQVMLKLYNKQHIDQLYLVSNKFVNTISQSPQIVQLLPLFPEKNTIDVMQNRAWDYLYEPDPKTLLDILLQRYIESQVYQAVVENLASEQAARMFAMKTATDNGETLIKELKLVYNKARQAGITQELTEIIGGAAAV
ncbi:F0F1 ATP synthase subunit gamma [Candidatus Erwinia haradaeae]|uniref:ATP synthase gamma chain n=1 Tax=Candidatus Erwinia haradaeae TaxID=1922217 RepID=A0A803GC14_9GAMM|nr:F0F1 ATP synthase subunit gamma [Candidatus Erwinia haradaeae]VFP87128.1 ATP synthase gamma chain [Candidatus Erwinia haradaeae]